MPTKKPTVTYRSMLAESARTAWERKSLWVFGLFAALLSTGGAYEMVVKDARVGMLLRQGYARACESAGTSWFGPLVRDLLAFGPGRVTVLVTLAAALAALLVAASVVSQGALIAGVGKKAVGDAAAANAGRAAFWHLLWLNVLHKSAHALLSLLAVLPLWYVAVRPGTDSVAVAFVSLALLLPLTISVSVLFMLASVHAARTGEHTLNAIEHAVILFRAHALAAFETGLIVFSCVVAAVAGFLLLGTLASIPFALTVFISLLIGNAVLFTAVNVVGAAGLILMLFAFAGATTTFQYAVWTRFHDHAASKNRTISKIHRVWRGR